MAQATGKPRTARRKVLTSEAEGAVNPLEGKDDPSAPAVSRPAMAHPRTDTADAFFSDPEDGPARVSDDLAELLAEDFLKSATSGEDSDEEEMDQIVDEEYGGPFIETSGREEFATGTDESNPEDADAEPLPRAVHGIIQPPPRNR
jgi:hypothetical protein